MPIHLPTRRSFITQLGAAMTLSQLPATGAEVDPDLIAILNDTHIGAEQASDSPLPCNLRTTVEWLLSLPKRPAAVVLNGDLALKDGQRGDYERLAKLISPLQAADLPLHLTMGNHDDRGVFYDVMKPSSSAVESKFVSLIEMTHVNLFLLDSLKATMVTQGLLGSAQLEWLIRLLDAHADKPALLFAHHNPRLGGDPRHFPGGLEDSEPLWRALSTRRQVKAYIHGHIHHRNFFEHEGIHILNTPATSYVADKKTSTTGWTMLRLTSEGVVATTHTHQSDHAWNGMQVALRWR
ncbi:MAG: metallophosphoesterase family protein [Prosthecobacter sp.]